MNSASSDFWDINELLRMPPYAATLLEAGTFTVNGTSTIAEARAANSHWGSDQRDDVGPRKKAPLKAGTFRICHCLFVGQRLRRYGCVMTILTVATAV